MEGPSCAIHSRQDADPRGFQHRTPHSMLYLPFQDNALHFIKSFDLRIPAVHTNTRARWAIQENPTTFSQESSLRDGLLTQLWEATVTEGDRSSSVMCQSPSPSFMALRRGEAEPGSRGSSSSQLDLGQHTPINISNTV